MNAEAARLQARDTHAVNPSGLDAEGQVSSAYDLALIARAGMAMPDFREYVATQTSSISAPKKKRIEIYNHNRLLREYDGAIGIKNGYTTAARASFVGAATRGGRTLVVTLMRADPLVWHEAAALLDWGFAAVEAGRRAGRPARRPAARAGGRAGRPCRGARRPVQAQPAAAEQPAEEDGGFPCGRAVASRCCCWRARRPAPPGRGPPPPAPAPAGAAPPARPGSGLSPGAGSAPREPGQRRRALNAERTPCTTTTAASAPIAPMPTEAARTATSAPGGAAGRAGCGRAAAGSASSRCGGT